MRIIIQSPKNNTKFFHNYPSQNKVPLTSTESSQAAENSIRFVQGANAFIAFFQAYESGRVSYSHFLHREECSQNSSLLIALVMLNLLWALIAIFGISSINSRKTLRVEIYKILLFFIGLSRTAFYISIYNSMKHGLMASVCNPFYRNDFFIASAVLEGVAIMVLLYLLQTTKDYMKARERKY